MKRIIALLFAAIVLLLCAVPAFAADYATIDENDIRIAYEGSEDDVDVVLYSADAEDSGAAVLTVGAAESDSGFNFSLATILIIIVCSVLAAAIVVVVVILARRNRNN